MQAESKGKYLYTIWNLTPTKVGEAPELAPGEAPKIPEGGEDAPLTPEEQKKEDEYWKEKNDDMKTERDSMMDIVFKDGLGSFNLQEKRFEGEYREIKGEDGSVTKVYTDGSMETAWADGSREAMDIEGNHYKEDKDGKQTVTAPDGSVATIADDGTVRVNKPDGSKVQIREDGSSTWTNPAGVEIDYDEDGERTAIGFEGGEKLSLVNGMFPQGKGELAGPDGASLKWANGMMPGPEGDRRYSFEITDKNGIVGKASYDPFTSFELDKEKTEEMRRNGMEREIATKSYTSIEAAGLDGSSYQVKLDNMNSDNYEYKYTAANGISMSKTVTESSHESSITYPDGRRREWHADANAVTLVEIDANGQRTEAIIQTKEDGTTIARYQDGTTVTCTPDGMSTVHKADGTYIITSSNDKSFEYQGADGQNFMRDAEGRIMTAHLKHPDGSFMDFSHGKWNFTDASGQLLAAWEMDENENMKDFRSDGREEKGQSTQSDSAGNILSADIPEEDIPEGDIPAKAEIMGTYDCKIAFWGEGGSAITFADGGEGQIIFISKGDEDFVFKGVYDAATATAKIWYDLDEESGEFKIVFRKQEKRIVLLMLAISREDGDESAIYISAVKR